MNVSISAMSGQILESFIQLLYPPECLLCKRKITRQFPKDVLCPLCINKLKANHPPFCLKCSRHIEDISSPRCSNCQHHSFHFDFAWCACLYDESMKQLLHHFKFHQRTYLRFLFTELIVDFINSYNLDIHQFDLIIPIPLSATRMRERGFNQTLLLAQLITKKYQLPLRDNILQRIHHTQNSSHLSPKERFTNIKGAFRIKQSSRVKNKSILIVDDLLTTGATTSQAAFVLKEAGANRVGVLTLAVAI